MAKKRLLLLDGDIFAYQAALQAEREVDFGDSPSTVYLLGDTKQAVDSAKDKIAVISEYLKADGVRFFLTDSLNWRKLYVDPNYKSNRKEVRKPIGLHKVRDALFSYYPSELEPELEADDLMGIRATDPSYFEGWEKVIVSIDKDMRTIPASVYNPDKDLKPVVVSEQEADEWFYTQAIAGDVTDGYKGCEGIGIGRASNYIGSKTGVRKYEHTFLSGKRKGCTEVRYEEIPMDSMWDIVCSLYSKAGMSESDALKNARCARILRHGDYDFNTKKVKLWTP